MHGAEIQETIRPNEISAIQSFPNVFLPSKSKFHVPRSSARAKTTPNKRSIQSRTLNNLRIFLFSLYFFPIISLFFCHLVQLLPILTKSKNVHSNHVSSTEDDDNAQYLDQIAQPSTWKTNQNRLISTFTGDPHTGASSFFRIFRTNCLRTCSLLRVHH